ncbi:hypothetical protein K439DRAFT_1228823, partial [Ramaria rubella]
CVCGNAQAIHRCEDCHLSSILSDTCMVDMHHHHPLHRIVTRIPAPGGWYFKPNELSKLGLVIHLGHRGQACTHAQPSASKNMVIIHSNGVHHTKILPCACEHAQSFLTQLMCAHFFPATTERPQTLFTHTLLHDFCTHTHESGVNAYAYYAAIRRLTDQTFQHKVNFLRVVRVWRHLQDLLRSGQAYPINEYLPKSSHSSLAVLCPACPQLHINMPPHWEEDVSKHRYQFSGALDGNFRVCLKDKPFDLNEQALSDGCAYSVAESEYQQYLSEVTDDAELATCTGFKAGDIMRQSRNKGLLVTGVVAMSCACHSIVLPNAFVDLYKGKQFSNVDYVIGNAL